MIPERKIKLVCTIGPATEKYEIIKKMINEGMDVARLNFSHGSYEFFKNAIKNLRKASAELGKEIAVLADLQGPKIRIGSFSTGEIFLKKGAEIKIDTLTQKGNEKRIGLNTPEIINDIKTGERILLSDGLVSLKVIEKSKDALICEIQNGGIVRNKAGVNLPDTSLRLPSLTFKDLEDLQFAVKEEVDYLALSFVRQKEDIYQLKSKLDEYEFDVPVISKIEKPEAMKNILSIIEASDGIMVARGDLGVECPPELVPLYQKRIIQECNRRGKLVITATQMLESMIYNPRPTRAETSDIANAIFDGTSAVMLSGETSIGKYPIESIQTVNHIAEVTEDSLYKQTVQRRRQDFYIFSEHNVSEGIARGACMLADTLNAKIIACLTHSGNTARFLAKYRPRVHILAVSDDIKTVRKMSLIWGSSSLKVEKIKNTDESFKELERKIESLPLLHNNDRIVITAGIPTLEKGSTNTIKVSTIVKE